MKKSIVLVSKDATLPEYFGVYNKNEHRTPNIDRLAEKGTVFMRHYTAAPSTAMAFLSMFTGKYPYQLPYKRYHEVPFYNDVTMFDILEEKGYECHLIWSTNYIAKAEKYSKCFGKNTIHHELVYFNEHCGSNATFAKENRKRSEEEVNKYFDYLVNEIKTINHKEKNIFLWIHMPHCIKGRISYGDDIDVFDKLIGYLASVFGDDSIYITADHGHMNGNKGCTGYGFHPYEQAARIPLITPRIDGLKYINFPTSNIQLIDIIINNKINRNDFVLCDTAYYAQKSRKLAIITENYSYIFVKSTKTEELYDLKYDPYQQLNLALPMIRKDKDRRVNVDIRQLIYKPNWDEITGVLEEFRRLKKLIWRDGSYFEEHLFSLRFKLIKFVAPIIKKIRRKKA